VSVAATEGTRAGGLRRDGSQASRRQRHPGGEGEKHLTAIDRHAEPPVGADEFLNVRRADRGGEDTRKRDVSRTPVAVALILCFFYRAKATPTQGMLMRCIPLVMAGVLAVAAAAPPHKLHAQASGRIQIDTFSLANGLKVVLAPDHSTQVVAVNVWFNVGSRNEVAGRTG